MCVCAGRGGLAPGGSCPRSAGAETHVSPASASPPQFWRVCPSSARAAGAAPLTRVSRVRSRRRHTLPGAAHDVPLPTRPWELRCHPTTRYTNSPWRAGPARATPPADPDATISTQEDCRDGEEGLRHSTPRGGLCCHVITSKGQNSEPVVHWRLCEQVASSKLLCTRHRAGHRARQTQTAREIERHEEVRVRRGAMGGVCVRVRVPVLTRTAGGGSKEPMIRRVEL